MLSTDGSRLNEGEARGHVLQIILSLTKSFYRPDSVFIRLELSIFFNSKTCLRAQSEPEPAL